MGSGSGSDSGGGAGCEEINETDGGPCFWLLLWLVEEVP